MQRAQGSSSQNQSILDLTDRSATSKPCPACGSKCAIRLRRGPLAKLRSAWMDEYPMQCRVCREQYYAPLDSLTKPPR